MQTLRGCENKFSNVKKKKGVSYRFGSTMNSDGQQKCFQFFLFILTLKKVSFNDVIIHIVINLEVLAHLESLLLFITIFS